MRLIICPDTVIAGGLASGRSIRRTPTLRKIAAFPSECDVPRWRSFVRAVIHAACILLIQLWRSADFQTCIEASFLWNVGYYSRVWKGSPHRRAGISPIFSRSGVNFSLAGQKLRFAPLRGACKNLLSLFQERGDFIGVAAFALMPRGCSYQDETAFSPTMNLSIFSNIV